MEDKVSGQEISVNTFWLMFGAVLVFCEYRRPQDLLSLIERVNSLHLQGVRVPILTQPHVAVVV
ncbi:unnamed protein product [Ectocarpus sp. 12 AP-2014]